MLPTQQEARGWRRRLRFLCPNVAHNLRRSLQFPEPPLSHFDYEAVELGNHQDSFEHFHSFGVQRFSHHLLLCQDSALCARPQQMLGKISSIPRNGPD